MVRRAFWTSGLLTLAVTVVLWVLAVVMPVGVLVWQVQWGFRHRQGVVGSGVFT